MEDFLSLLGSAGDGFGLGGASSAPMVSPYPDASGAIGGPAVAQGGLADQQPGAGLNQAAPQQAQQQYIQPNWTGGGGGSNGIAKAGESC